MSTARQVFELQLDRAHALALRAVALSAVADGEALEPLDRELARLDEQLDRVEAEPDLPMQRLAERLGLSEPEQELVWLAVAMVADPRIVNHGDALIGSAARRGLPLSLYTTMVGADGSRGRALALSMRPSHPLFRYQLIELTEPAASASASPLRPSGRLVAYLAGEDDIDDALGAVGGRLELPDEPAYDARQERALRKLVDGLDSPAPLVTLIEGPEGSGRRSAAAAAAVGLGLEVLSLDVRRLPGDARALEDALGALRRESLLRGAVALVANIDDLTGAESERNPALRTLARTIDSMEGPVVLTSARPGLDLGLERNVLRVDWPVADTATRRALWERALGEEAARIGDDLDRLSLRYRLGPGGIARATTAARIIARPDGGRLEEAHIVAGVRNNIAERLGSLARRVEVSQSWDDLVVSPDILDQINALIARVRHAHTVYEQWGFDTKAARGIGVPALFSGPPGTGKTMVAGIIARELDLELLQVDLSQVVSKWIGETEKQLSKLFDAAEAGHALLLFDEADALFAKRTEVKGATDRYANLEVNYLLQRVESFGGITILTTNLDASIDKALKRRLAAHVSFWPPDADEREELWRRLLTTRAAPLGDDLDVEHLAQAYPDMTGANIRNAVLSAAFLAAAEETSITQDHLVRAARGEYRTMGRVLR